MAVALAYGIEREDSPYPERATFLIDEDGTVAAVMCNVDPTTHADDVLARFTSR
jgi:peroxiredoxin